MTRLVQDMETAGLLSRRADPGDGRVALIALTRRGRSLIERSRNRKIELVRQLLAGSTPTENAALRTALDLLEPLSAR